MVSFIQNGPRFYKESDFFDVKREWKISHISRTTDPKHTKIPSLLDFFFELIISKGQHNILSRSADSL